MELENTAKSLFESGKDTELQELFNKELTKSYSVELWKLYVKWLSKKDRSVAMEGFDVALQAIGWLDGGIWLDVIQHYQTWTSDKNNLEQVQLHKLLDKLRSIFQLAIATPTDQLTEIWNKYNQFENNRSGNLAHKFIADRSPIYMTARLAYKEITSLTETINQYKKSFMKRKKIKYNDRDCLLIQHWRRYLGWEISNPMGLESSLHLQRLTKVYFCCLDMMKYFPHFYIEAFYELNKMNADGEQFLRIGLANNPESLTLLFFLSNHLQIAKKTSMTEISPFFEDCISRLTKNIQDIKNKYESDKTALRNKEVPAEPEELHQHQQMIEKMIEAIQMKEKTHMNALSQNISLVYIMYMRMARREGEKAGRSVYAAARKNNFASCHIHIASALMEYHVSKDASIAGRLFESALKMFADDLSSYSEIVKAYMDFLISCNNDTNARALFERAISLLPPELSKSIWNSMLFYEHRYGDISVIEKLTSRYESIVDNENSSDKWNGIRTLYQYMDMDQVGKELGLNILGKYKSKVPKFKSALLTTSFATSNKKESYKDKVYVKYPAMTSVMPERYPKPELTKWKQFKVDENIKARAQQQVSVAPAISTTNIAAATAVPVKSTRPTSPQIRSPKVGSPRPLPRHEVRLPPMVVSFIERLPPAHVYNGPLLGVNDMIQVFQSLNLPLFRGEYIYASADLMKIHPFYASASASADAGGAPGAGGLGPQRPGFIGMKRKMDGIGGHMKKMRE